VTVLGALLRRPAVRAVKDEDVWGRWARGDDAPAGVTPAGVRVDRTSALQLSAVWACVSLISESISMLPLDTFFRQNGARHPFRPRPAWLLEPNPDQARHQWVQQQLLSLLLDGTAYVFTVRDDRGDILEAWNVPSWNVRPKRDLGQVVYEVTDPERGPLTLNRAQMFHVPGMSWPGELRGMAPLEAARHMLGAGLAAQEFAERYYGQGMHQSGVVEVPGDLTQEQAKDLKGDFQRMAGGLRKAHLPAVLTGGAQWKPSICTPEQAQFLQSRAFSVSEIARFFRVPPHLIGDMEKSTSWGTGIEQQGIGFVTYTLGPWLERLEQAYTRHMLLLGPGSRAFAKFNVNGLLRGDFKTRNEGYAIGRNWGWLNADDVRALEDMPPLPDGQGQEYLVPLNMRPADQPPQPPTPPTPELSDPADSWETRQPAPTINVDARTTVEPQTINVDARTNVDELAATVKPPDVHVDARTEIAEGAVQVQPPDVHVDARTEIAQGAIVSNTPVLVEAPKKQTRQVERDAAGRIIRVVDE
jgi:HK97 family phage portal protein